MNQDWQQRTARLLGERAVEDLNRARVIVFGLGGVGGYVVEALARAGVGTLGLVDADTIAPSNLNRQILALRSTVGMRKTQVAAVRIADICPDIRVREYPMFYLPDNADAIDLSEYDYIVDAIDTVSAKLALIERSKSLGIPYIGVLGTGNKRDPAALRVGDLCDTRVCPLARVMRRECKARGIAHACVVWSDEIPTVPDADPRVPSSMATVPSAAGLLAASHVIEKLIDKHGEVCA